MENKHIPISFFKPQLIKKENRYAPGWAPSETDFYTEMFAIRDGVYYDVVSEIRKEPDHHKRQEIKGRKLKALTISATIAKHRKVENCTHTGLLNIDIDPDDNPEITDWAYIRDLLFEMPEVVVSFLSASEKGVSLVFKVDPAKHKDTFFSIKDELFDNFNIKIDKGTHDVSRLRYVSFDPDAKIRTDFDNIPITLPSKAYLENKRERKRAVTPLTPIADKDSDKAFEAAIKRAESKYGPFGDGHKHYFLAIIGGFCNTIGMSQDYCENMVLRHYGSFTNISNDHLLRPVRNVYKTYKSQFNTAPERELTNRLNDKITGAIVTEFIRKGITPRESDLSHIAEKFEANIDRVREVKDRALDEFDHEKDKDFGATPTTVKDKEIKFWILDDDKITIDKRMFREFLLRNGVHRYRVTLDRWILIRIQDNIISEINKADLKKIVMDYLEKVRRMDVYQYIAQNVTKTFADDWLELLPEAEITFKHDDKLSVNVFYQNGYLAITSKTRNFHPYADLDGYIWDTQILPRKYTPVAKRAQSDFERFVFNVAGGSAAITEVEKESANKRYLSICTSLGYMIHDYKNLAYCPAVVFNDEVISENPEGGTGKGILIKALKNFKNTVSFDGKTFNFDRSFVYQRVNLDTKVMAFEDVNKNFDFERLFSVITDGIEVEKKNKGTFEIPFKDSPKIILTTNYALRGEGNSHDRRRFEIELTRHYTATYTPLDEFGKLLFDEWTAEEWNTFDVFMSECVQSFLKNGLVKQDLIHLPEKRLINNTAPEFIDFMKEWMEGQNNAPAGDFKKTELYNAFLQENDTFRKWCSSKRFCGWVREYLVFHKIPFEDARLMDAKVFRFKGAF